MLLATDVADHRPEHVLIAVDGSAITPEVLAWGQLVAGRLSARATAITAVGSAVPSPLLAPDAPASPYGAAGGDDAPPGYGPARGPWAERMRGPGFDPAHGDSEVAFGEAGQEIVAAAARHDSGMIVMGRRGAGGLRRALLGSVTREVLRSAPCPVLVVVEGGHA